MAMDYFQVRYPDSSVVFDMSLVYIGVAFFTVLANNLLVETFSLNSRINFGKSTFGSSTEFKKSLQHVSGYIMSFITLIFVVICEVWWEAFAQATSYTVNLVAVAVVAVGCTGMIRFRNPTVFSNNKFQIINANLRNLPNLERWHYCSIVLGQLL